MLEDEALEVEAVVLGAVVLAAVVLFLALVDNVFPVDVEPLFVCEALRLNDEPVFDEDAVPEAELGEVVFASEQDPPSARFWLPPFPPHHLSFR